MVMPLFLPWKMFTVACSRYDLNGGSRAPLTEGLPDYTHSTFGPEALRILEGFETTECCEGTPMAPVFTFSHTSLSPHFFQGLLTKWLLTIDQVRLYT